MRIAYTTADSAATSPARPAATAVAAKASAQRSVATLPPATTLVARPRIQQLRIAAPSHLTAGPARPRARITGPVGDGAVNRVPDVRRVQRRLFDLGFPVGADGIFGDETDRYIRIFSAILEHAGTWESRRDVLRPNSAYTLRLFADDAPQWVALDTEGLGWVRTDREGYHWGTDAVREILDAAGASYVEYAARTGASPIGVNDVTLENGDVLYRRGRPEHITHRTGLDIDVRLPRIRGDEERWGASIYSPSYDRDAMLEVVLAFAAQDRVVSMIFADSDLFERVRRAAPEAYDKLVFAWDHDNHLHVDVRIDPPVIVPFRRR